MKREKTVNILCTIVFLTTTFLLWKQFSTVMVYYDDYGYYSLTYGEFEHRGNTYTLIELFNFLKNHYANANGRILYFFVWLVIYGLGGLVAVQIAAALCTGCILYLLWRIATKLGGNEPVSAAFLICAFYGLLEITLHRQGTYWFAAFWVYIPPLIPLLLFCLLYFENDKKVRSSALHVLMAFFIFCAAFSQEQIGVATICFTILLTVLAIYEKTVTWWNCAYIGTAVVGAMIVLMSPAIQARGARRSAGDLPFLQQMVCNIKTLVGNFFSPSNRLILIALFVAFTLICLQLFITEKKKNWKIVDVTLGVVGISATVNYYFDNAIINIISKGHRWMVAAIFGIALIMIMIEISRYYVKNGNYCNLILFYTAILSIACLSFVSELPIRLLIFPMFLLFLVIVDGLQIVKRLRGRFGTCLLLLICTVTGIASWENAYYIYEGYKENKTVHVYNDTSLRNASQRIMQGESITEINLKKVPDILYGSEMVYYPGFENIISWMENYYDIPDGIKLNYLDGIKIDYLEGDLNHKVGRDMDSCIWVSGRWQDGWLGKESEVIIQSGEEGFLHFTFYQPKEEYQSMGGEILIGGIKHTFALCGEETSIDISVEADTTIDVVISMSDDFKADGNDVRRLSVMLIDVKGG